MIRRGLTWPHLNVMSRILPSGGMSGHHTIRVIRRATGPPPRSATFRLLRARAICRRERPHPGAQPSPIRTGSASHRPDPHRSGGTGGTPPRPRSGRGPHPLWQGVRAAQTCPSATSLPTRCGSRSCSSPGTWLPGCSGSACAAHRLAGSKNGFGTASSTWRRASHMAAAAAGCACSAAGPGRTSCARRSSDCAPARCLTPLPPALPPISSAAPHGSRSRL